MPKNWFEWHDLYKTEPKLQQRLQIVQEYISSAIDASSPGIIRVVSLCAGDGRDLLGTLSRHPRAKDVYARLVELNPQLYEQGRAAIESAGLSTQLEFINGDATNSSNYIGAVPADIVIVCGIFGNLSDEAELKRLIRNLPFLSKKGSFVIWTRGHSNGIAYSDTVRKVFRDADFEEVSFRLTFTGDMGVGIHRYLGEGLPLLKDQQLFVFSGDPDKYRNVSVVH
ncbi:MAG: class I SAM-dependent methyltransferase family protein [Stigonema ocellatum SAG 48.90 = DSM 106950]|nr:class I SAM-dependent methyltransferase family protein [Stigonema ocellatum SAG 48.90 = DSM 106950]